jgi:hypothetical protein
MNLDVPKIFSRVIDPKKNPDKTRNIMDLFDSVLFNEVRLIFLSRNLFYP